MTNEATQDARLVVMLGDAAVAAVWAAVMTMVLVWLSFVVLIAAPSLEAITAGLCGVSAEAMAVIWIAALVLCKMIALCFAVTAFGLWMWKRRVARRMAR